MQSDAELVNDTLAGWEQAFEQLVRRYERPVRAAALHVLKDRHLACDVAQEAFLRACRQLGSLQQPGAFGGWLLRIAHRCALGATARRHNEQSREPCERIATAVDALTKSLDISPRRNWAQFWLGRALYESGRYDEAIYRPTRVIEMMNEHNLSIPSYHLARALAFQGKGMTDMAQVDFEKALPKMIQGLRYPDAARSFDLADDLLQCADGMREGCHGAPTKDQSVVMMINRLRILTGQNFGYDPNAGAEQNEQAIAAWEQWAKDSGRMQLTPDAQLVPIPQASDGK